MEFSDKISMLDVILGSDLSWNDHISTTAKATACTLVSYLGLDAISPPVHFLHCIRLKFVPVSNMAFICGKGLQAFSCHTGCNSEASI